MAGSTLDANKCGGITGIPCLDRVDLGLYGQNAQSISDAPLRELSMLCSQTLLIGEGSASTSTSERFLLHSG